MIRSVFRPARHFSVSASRFISKGDSLPTIPLAEDAPSKQVNLADEVAKGRHILVGVPGAFSPGCSQSHIPGYLIHEKSFKDRNVQHIWVVAVNDAFTTGAWKKSLEEDADDGFLRVLSDADGSFSREIDTLFDATKFFGNWRSKRFAAIIDDGEVTKAFVEPDATGIDVSSARKILEEL